MKPTNELEKSTTEHHQFKERIKTGITGNA
jgi:hypothetical protein